MIWKPFDYQQRMVDWMVERDRNAVFASPGLGKTAVALKWFEHLLCTGASRGVLLVAPIRVCSITWPNQVAQWDHSKWMRVANLRTEAGRKAWRDGNAEIFLINPEMLQSLVPILFKGKKKPPVDTFLWDELSLCKNPTSKRVNTLRPHLPPFKQRSGLTGTPVPNDYQDLFAQARLLDDGERLGRSFHAYRQAYFSSDYMGYKWTINPGAKERIDAKLSDIALVMLSEDYLDVPTTSTEDIEVTLPPEARKAYKTLEKELLLQLEESDVVALSAAALANKLLQMTSGSIYGEDKVVNHIHDAKLEALLKLRKKHGKEPMLVLVSYKHESEHLLKHIKGSQMFDERDLDKWKAGKIHTWVADFRSLSHGIDGIQQGGRIAVWHTPPWSHEGYVQTNARLIRTGQTQRTIIYRLIASNTIDDAVVEALRDKADTQSGLMHALKNLQKMRLSD